MNESPTAYLLNSVYPTLTDALTELAVKKPEDPMVIMVIYAIAMVGKMAVGK
jgi:hypothetical protein